MDSVIIEEKEKRRKKERAYSAAEIESMVKQYGNMVFRIALVKMKQKESADDIFQEVFIKLIKLKSRLDSHEHERAWMIRTTLNCCKDTWKSAWVRHVVYGQLDGTNEEDGKMPESEEGVYGLVLKLPDKYRVIVHLYYYEEFSVKEIGIMLKMNGNTISTRLKRAREILKKELVEGGFNYEI